MNQIASRVFAAQSGRTSWRYIAADLLGRLWRGHSRAETERLMDEALFNPDVAADIADMLTVPATRTETAKRLNTWLFNVGVDGSDEENQ